jgi:hypothetical protein
VVEAGYLFPSQKGGYQRLAFAVDAAQAEDLLEAMLAEPLRNAFEKGCFAPLEKTDCHYCGFKAACDMEAIKARVKAGKGGA